MNRHKTSHEKSLNAWSKKAEKIAIATEKEVNEAEKAKKKEWSDTIMKLTNQSKHLISQVKSLKKSRTEQTRSMENSLVTHTVKWKKCSCPR